MEDNNIAGDLPDIVPIVGKSKARILSEKRTRKRTGSTRTPKTSVTASLVTNRGANPSAIEQSLHVPTGIVDDPLADQVETLVNQRYLHGDKIHPSELDQPTRPIEEIARLFPRQEKEHLAALDTGSGAGEQRNPLKASHFKYSHPNQPIDYSFDFLGLHEPFYPDKQPPSDTLPSIKSKISVHFG